MKTKLLSLALLCALLAGCNKTTEPASPAVAPAAKPAATGPNLTAQPDVGKIEQVPVTASGSATTPGAAVNQALKTAIMQVNGTKIEATTATLNTFSQITGQLDVETSGGSDSIKASATVQSSHFAEMIVAQSQGVVTTFQVVKMTPPAEKGGMFTADISATIAKFKAPADSGKIKIVVAPLRSDRASFDIGGRAVPADVVLGQLRQQMIDALTQSGRFTVLDRQFESELEGELDLITSGKAVNQDFAKLGQALTADLVWVGVVNELNYTRHARQLQTSDRELVSFSGGWSISHRMINLATRQILQSGTIEGRAPSMAPTTLGSGINADAVLQDMRQIIAKRSAEAILLQTFPISVVERNGMEVILSQGGASVVQGARYRLYLQGKELRDPQTGQSLGNTETDCCDVVITRVAPKMSYGVLENVTAKLDGVAPGALQVREMLPPRSEQSAAAAQAAAPSSAKKPNGPAEPKAQAKTSKKAEAKAGADDKDW
ncbi:CsgG/HfaB family protein [Massilia sp. CF038]|uniref:CsgG/HfaB family protein n=1 Tax=Massilia sp. CF038 TaxID=1881045 RepID=UPI00091D8698|nr:CsgG/HfaB family protein [Massilia sp. CF038]SHH05091.1 Curli production assembly/transport component CsgG [Massilia sp. CF038]